MKNQSQLNVENYYIAPKTAMQTLIAEFSDIKYTQVIKRANELLELEKQQLLHASLTINHTKP